jgi:hypothetical protein
MGKLLVMLATGPLMILSVLVAIPIFLIFAALSGITAVFFCWTLVWAAIWVMGADPDASVRFLQALGITCAGAMAIMALTWAIAAIKDVVSIPFRQKPPVKAATTPLKPSPPAYPRPALLPANDPGFRQV